MSSSSVEQCALCASSMHDVHHAIVEVNVVIGVLVVHCELLVVRVVPVVVCDDAVVRRTLVLMCLQLGRVECRLDRVLRKCHNELHKITGPHKDAHSTNFFNSYSPTKKNHASTAKPIIKTRDRMYNVDGGASLHVMGKN